MKTTFFLLDGVGDVGKTPLEVAKTPALDHLAFNGLQGLLVPAGLGKEIPIEDASTMTFSLLGYDPRKFDHGRGMLEAVGAGMKMRDGDLAARCNFATVDSNWKIIDMRAGRIENITHLIEAINDIDFDVDFELRATRKYRGVLVFRNGDLGDNVSKVDPHYVGGKVLPARALDPQSERAAKILNEFLEKSYKVLNNHPANKQRRKKGLLPANFILPRGFESHVPKLKPFREKYRLKAAALTGFEINVGMCMLMGMDIIRVPEDIGEKELEVKRAPLLAARKKYDFVFVHFKNTDVPGHDGDFKKKIAEIDRTDEFIGELDLENTRVIVASDHCTPWRKKSHSADLIPSIVARAGPAGGRKFAEKYCLDYKMKSHEFLPFALSQFK